MKKSLNLILVLLTAVMVLSCLSVSVMAANAKVEYVGGEDQFDFAPGSSYTATDLFDNFKGIMPGDTREQIIEFENSARDFDYIKLYLRAEPHDEETNPLSPAVAETETVATMRDFLAQLDLTVSYVNEDGETVTLDALPEDSNDLIDGVFLGKFENGEEAAITVKLTVPIEMGSEYMDRIGEVDWVFTAECFNDIHIPIVPENISVRKVWKDQGNIRPDSIKVNLLRDGEVYDTVTLSDKNNWSFAWDNLDWRYEWKVEEDEVPAGYRVYYQTSGNGRATTIINQQIPWNDLTVEKVWVDGDSADRPDYVDVVLLRDGEYHDEVRLSEENDWSYTWEQLSNKNSWSVFEKRVPDGYRVSYSFDEEDYTIIVTNTLDELADDSEYPENDSEVPGTDLDALETELTVSKVWVDNGENRPESIKVYLLADGEMTEGVELSAANSWTYTWTELSGGKSWSVVENDVDGYTAEYDVKETENGMAVTITNTAVEKAPVDLTVKKAWSDNGTGRPDYAEIVLYNGETAVEAVILNEANGWTYTWKNLDGSGNWQVIEENVPKGYVPSYEVTNGVVTVTNTAALIQTGQLNWPIPVLCIGGALLLILGCVMMFRKRKNNA